MYMFLAPPRQGSAGHVFFKLWLWCVRPLHQYLFQSAIQPAAQQHSSVSLLAGAAQDRLLHQVFISHTGQDTAACGFATNVLKPKLETAGVYVFMDFSNLQLGCHWPDTLIHAAANSMVVVVVVSKNYIKRYWCMLELDLALNSHKFSNCKPLVIPVLINSKKRKSISDLLTSNAVSELWSKEVQKLAKSHPSLSKWVDVERWAANAAKVVKELQAVRRPAFNQPKDIDTEIADSVTEQVLKVLPRRLYQHPFLAGKRESVARLTMRLKQPGGRKLLWIYGLGE
jgi:hypothetical protein